MPFLSKRNVFSAIGVLSFIVIVALGFIALGSPAQVRAKRFDEERINDLKAIVRDIGYFAKAHKRLPRSLAELEGGAYYYDLITIDPETGSSYLYDPKDVDRYEICAVFSTEYQPAERVVDSRNFGFSAFDIFGLAYDGTPEVRTYVDREWYYEPGEWCFEREVPGLSVQETIIPAVPQSSLSQ